jgi:hypothetical protein
MMMLNANILDSSKKTMTKNNNPNDRKEQLLLGNIYFLALALISKK